MNARKRSLLCSCLFLANLISRSTMAAQDIAPSNIAEKSQASIRSQSQVVLVPTLVTNSHGDLIFGLGANDFVIEDNGVAQNVLLDEQPETVPLSIVVVVQRGRSAYLHFTGRKPGRKFPDCRLDSPPCHTDMDGLGTMLEGVIGERATRIAIVTFDDEVQLFQKFTNDPASFGQRLRLLTPGGQGAGILDAVQFSLGLLDREPRGNRHVLLLISEKRDHGSHGVSVERIVREVVASNTLLYSVAFSPPRSEFWRDVRGKNPAPGNAELIAPLRSSLQGMRKNTARELAELTGGEYYQFENRNEFDSNFGEVANRIRNRYLLSFQPKNPSPGLHTLTVRLRNSSRDDSVIARKSYWAVALPR